MKALLTILVALLWSVPVIIQAQVRAVYWPFSIIKVNQEIVEDLLIEGNDIYVKVSKDYWNVDIVVKISNKYMENYRRWLN